MCFVFIVEWMHWKRAALNGKCVATRIMLLNFSCSTVSLSVGSDGYFLPLFGCRFGITVFELNISLWHQKSSWPLRTFKSNLMPINNWQLWKHSQNDILKFNQLIYETHLIFETQWGINKQLQSHKPNMKPFKIKFYRKYLYRMLTLLNLLKYVIVFFRMIKVTFEPCGCFIHRRLVDGLRFRSSLLVTGLMLCYYYSTIGNLAQI